MILYHINVNEISRDSRLNSRIIFTQHYSLQSLLTCCYRFCCCDISRFVLDFIFNFHFFRIFDIRKNYKNAIDFQIILQEMKKQNKFIYRFLEAYISGTGYLCTPLHNSSLRPNSFDRLRVPVRIYSYMFCYQTRKFVACLRCNFYYNLKKEK